MISLRFTILMSYFMRSLLYIVADFLYRLIFGTCSTLTGDMNKVILVKGKVFSRLLILMSVEQFKRLKERAKKS